MGALTSLGIYIIDNSQKAILKMIPHLDNIFSYEEKIIELLNSKNPKLAKYFENTKYSRILQSSFLTLTGKSEEFSDISKLFEELDFTIIDSNYGPGFRKTQVNVLPTTTTNPNVPATPYQVSVNGSYTYGSNSLTIGFSHPESYKDLFYENPRKLQFARDSLKQQLEAKLGLEKPQEILLT